MLPRRRLRRHHKRITARDNNRMFVLSHEAPVLRSQRPAVALVDHLIRAYGEEGLDSKHEAFPES